MHWEMPFTCPCTSSRVGGDTAHAAALVASAGGGGGGGGGCTPPSSNGESLRGVSCPGEESGSLDDRLWGLVVVVSGWCGLDGDAHPTRAVAVFLDCFYVYMCGQWPSNTHTHTYVHTYTQCECHT